jgi:DNA-binding IclR family transcriptional regulator
MAGSTRGTTKTPPQRARPADAARGKPGALSQTVARALSILRTFDRDQREFGITEISARVRLPKTIVFRLVQTLREYDFLEQNPETTKYRIGIGAFEIGNLFKSPALEAESAPYMRQLVDETGHTAQLAVLHRNEMVIIARMEGRGPVKYGVSVGERRPIHSSAVGKAVLSILNPEQVDAILDEMPLRKMTPHTLIERKTLLADLAQTRQRGYSVNWEENTIGVASIAAPLTSRHADTLAALALAFPAGAAAKKELPKIGKLVSNAARGLASRI